MKSLVRIDALLRCFTPLEPEIRIEDILERTVIPKSSGYKLISDLVAEGLLRRKSRGVITLGPSARELFFAPIKSNMPLRVAPTTLSARTNLIAPRKSHLESRLLELVSTEQYRKPHPFVIGFANASTSHPWRLALEASLRAAAQRQSDVVAELIVYDAENDADTQVAQLSELQKAGADICIFSAAAETSHALNSKIWEMKQDGFPIIGVDRKCGPMRNLVSFVTASDETVGRVSALWMAEHLKGHGRIAMLSGLKNASPCTIRQRAALMTFRQFPGIEVVAIEHTDWLAERGYEIVNGYLSSGWVPDGVWCDSGLQGIGSLNAFRDNGFRRGLIPPHTGGEMNLMYKIAATEKVPLCGLDYPPAMGAVSFQIALDTLFGRQVPRIVETNLEIIITRGHETKSVRADIHAEKKINWNKSDTHVHAAGRLRGLQGSSSTKQIPSVD